MTAAPKPAGKVALATRDLAVGYGNRIIIDGLDVKIPAGEFTAIVGPNACGKSTLLKAFARMIRPVRGEVLLGETPVGEYGAKEFARRVSMLPQSNIAPEGIRVEDLVARGRYPHQGLFRQFTASDERAVLEAMEAAGVAALADREVSTLSGGQRQRVWIALVLAQAAPVVLLDEPTTYLDITHQVDVLNLARTMQQQGTTVVAVLHELSLAFRYASQCIVMSEGQVLAQGEVTDVVTAELISEVYRMPCRLITDPETGRPLVVPAS